MWRTLRLLAAAVVRNEESLREGFRRVAAADEERIRRATAAAEESRKAEAEAREARRKEDEARRAEEAEAREARRQEDEARRAEDAARRKEEAEAREARRKEEAEAREARRAEDEARRKENDARQKKLEAAIHRLVGDGDQRWGRLMEALTEGDLPVILRDYGVEGPVRRRQGASMNGRSCEWDLIADGREAAVVVEVKATLRPEDVSLFRERMDAFRQWMPDYDRSGKRIYGAMAYLTANEAVLTHAERRGFLLIRVVGSSASVRNSPGFAPALF